MMRRMRAVKNMRAVEERIESLFMEKSPVAYSQHDHEGAGRDTQEEDILCERDISDKIGEKYDTCDTCEEEPIDPAMTVSYEYFCKKTDTS
jgi:hypothetical protein